MAWSKRLAVTRIIPPPPGPWPSWDELMGEALAEARSAARAGEVPVGGVMVSPHGDILARAGNRVETSHDPSAHAEMLLVREACAKAGNHRLEGCIAVVTLEPCLMCLGALVHARVAGLVFGAADPKAGAAVSCLDGFDLPFLNHRVWHLGGIREGDCADLLHCFFSFRR